MEIAAVVPTGLCLFAIATQATAANRRMLAVIQSLESDKPPIQVYFNPKELSIDKAVPWLTDAGGTEEEPAVLFGGAAAKSLDVLLSLDGNPDVRPFVESIEELARVDDKLKRPPLLTFTWGRNNTFKGVIESVSVKYTVFQPDGTAVRAEVNLGMREASRAGVRRSCKVDEECPEQHACVQLTCQPR
jgi:hypothetical protein